MESAEEDEPKYVIQQFQHELNTFSKTLSTCAKTCNFTKAASLLNLVKPCLVLTSIDVLAMFCVRTHNLRLLLC